MTYAYKAIIHSLLCSDDNWICNYNFQTHYEGNVSKLADVSNVSFLFISLMRYTFLKVAKAFLLHWNLKKKHIFCYFLLLLKKKYSGSQWVGHRFYKTSHRLLSISGYVFVNTYKSTSLLRPNRYFPVCLAGKFIGHLSVCVFMKCLLKLYSWE